MNSSICRAIARAGAIVAVAMAGLFASGGAHALGTTAGTSITNIASLSYSVSTVPQSTITSSTTGSTSTGSVTAFTVDNKINVLVTTSDSAAVGAVPGQAVGVKTLTFSVTNTGNYTQGYALSTIQEADGQIASFASSPIDNFTSTGCTITAVLASGATGTIGATPNYIASLPPDQTATVSVTCAIPIGQVNNDVSVVALQAAATTSATTTLVTNFGGANGTTVIGAATVANVLADPAGTDDALHDGANSARSAYQVQTATLSVQKTVTTKCDPINGTTSPKNIPGAFVGYTITITNSGSASAILTSIADVINTNVNFDSDYITATSAATCNTVGSGGTAGGGGAGKGFLLNYVTGRGITNQYLTTSNGDSDGADFSSGQVNVIFANALPAAGAYSAGELKKNEALTIQYQVQIK